MRRILELKVTPDLTAMTLESFLVKSEPSLNTERARHLIHSGAVIVNGQRVHDASFRVVNGAKLHVGFDRSQDRAHPTFPLQMLSLDDDVLIANKPPGQHVQGTPFGDRGTLLREAELAVMKLSRDGKHPWNGFIALAHRIDRLASGLVAVALNRRTASILGKQLHDRSMTRRYLAIVCGSVESAQGEWDEPLIKIGPKVHVRRNGKRAITKFRVVARKAPDLTLLELSLVTGRTHQIRVHCAHAGHHILGDTFYGGPPANRVFLHARTLSFTHPRSRERVEFSADPDWKPRCWDSIERDET